MKTLWRPCPRKRNLELVKEDRDRTYEDRKDYD